MAYRQSIADEERRKFDPHAHAVTMITEPHRLNHDGMYFHTSGKISAIANGATQDFLLVVPAATYPHLQDIRIAVSRGDINILLTEDATVSANGSALTIRNPNRNSTNTPDLAIYTGPTVTGAGNTLHTFWFPPTAAGVGSSAGLVSQCLFEEWILKPSANYLLRVTNNSGGAVDLAYEFQFYELGYANEV